MPDPPSAPGSLDLAVLDEFLLQNLPSGTLGQVRLIQPGDDRWLSYDEAFALRNAIARVRNASGAARYVARQLCTQLGVASPEIPRLPDGAPLWPASLVGSLAHDTAVAVAVVAMHTAVRGIGVDIEPSEPVEEPVACIVATPAERFAFKNDFAGDKAIFCIKEAVFKAVYPQDGIWLEFSDVRILPARHAAETKYGRTVEWRVLTFPRTLAIAWWC